MQETLLIKFLKSLDHNEIRQFSDFVNSPTFNKNKRIAELFEMHYEFYPEFNSEELSEKHLFGKIFIKEEFKYSKIKNLISDLFGLGKEFLAFNAYRKDQRTRDKYLLQELRLRSLDVAFEKAFKHAEKQLEKNKAKDENYYLHEMDLRFELMSYYTPKKPNVNFHLLQERLDLFINYSAITLLKIYDIMLHENNQNNFSYNMKMFDNVMEYLKTNEISDNPTLEIYYYIILMERSKDEKYFYMLKDLREKYTDKLTVYDNYMLYLHMDGYCATAFNENCRTDLLGEQFNLSKENSMKDSTGLGKLLYFDFLNEVKKAVRVNEFEYAGEYIDKFMNRLSGEKENTLNFCYGFISYQKGDLDKALDYFSKANFNNFLIKIQVKIHLLQITFDKEYFEQAVLMIDSFKHFLSREKSILESIKLSVLEFLKITLELIKINSAEKGIDRSFQIEKIKRDVENMSNNRFGIKLWLRERAGEAVSN